MNKVLIIGGGAAGLMAAYAASSSGSIVTIFEKNNILGKKILITGKGRCNVTNSCELNEFIKNIPGNGKFLYSVFNNFFNDDLMNFFASSGVELKVERGGRVFPVSDKAKDIVDCFYNILRKNLVAIKLETDIKEIIVENKKAIGVIDSLGNKTFADKIILATGGSAFPGTGSTGDGVFMAKKIGHSIVDLSPALVPLNAKDTWVKSLMGLSLKNVEIKKIINNKLVEKSFGEMLFTHFGISGPIVLSLSRDVYDEIKKKNEVIFSIDLKPALSIEKLDARLQRDFEKFHKKQIKNALFELLPQKLISIILDLAFIDENKFVHQITKTERMRLLHIIKNLEIEIECTRSLGEAIVTKGGISTKEINPKTMESKLIKDLYIVGETLDIDGYTGGFNLQAAFSMGYVAGLNASSL